jgi:hypothetical protein
VRRPWFPARPVEEEFLDSAPFRLAETFAISRPAEEVWAELAGEHPLWWCGLLRSVTWTSSRPFGVGTTRTVQTIGSAVLLKERYFRWEEGRRKSFHVFESSLPLFVRFAEDYLVEPQGESSSRFTWTIAIEPRPFARPADPLNRALLSTLFRDTRRHYMRG